MDGWKPWLALAGIVVPLGLLRGHLSNVWADGHAIYAWLYVNNWTWGFLDSPGARRDLLYTTMRFVLNGVTLVVVVPSLTGLRRAHRATALPLLHAIVWAVAVNPLDDAISFQSGAGQLGFVALALIRPVGYMVGTAGRHRWRQPTAAALKRATV